MPYSLWIFKGMVYVFSLSLHPNKSGNQYHNRI